MNTRDNIQAELQVLRMENVRLTNELAKRNEYARFLEDENESIESETRTEYESKLVLMKKERDNALGKSQRGGVWSQERKCQGGKGQDACCRWRIWSDGMFGLLESCKLNKVNFGEYIEDILTRIFMGEEVDASFLPCDYVRHFEDGTDAEVTKTSQAVAWLLNFRKSKLYSKILVRLTRW